MVHWKRREKGVRKRDRHILLCRGSKFAFQSKLLHTHNTTRACAHTPFFHFGARWVCVLNATPWPVNPRKVRYPLYLVGTRAGLDSSRKFRASQDSIPSSSACCESLYQPRYPNPHISWHARELIACTQAEWN